MAAVDLFCTIILSSCLMTSCAAMMSSTFTVQTDATGKRLCSSEQPTTVISMEAGTLDGQCGVQCTVSATCQFYQFKGASAQCELFDYVPGNTSLTEIDYCVAFSIVPCSVQFLRALKPTDCTDIATHGCNRSGVFTIYIGPQADALSVYCDMTTDNNAWTIFQRRMNGGVDFYRTWVNYTKGFGSLKGEFWLGNEYLNLLTSAKRYVMRIDMMRVDGSSAYAEYDNFFVNPSADKYRLVSLGKYSGTAGDSLSSFHLGQPFATYDQPDPKNCAKTYKGAWWYSLLFGVCHQSNLNGHYYGGPHTSYADGMEWSTWTGYYYSLKTTEMQIRPVQRK